MKHLGDITKIKSPPHVDVIFGGSPCQDLSQAGKRAGLKHEGRGDEETTRSGLFYERYEALGNSICLPQWYWLEQKMRPYLPEHATMASLFDGIGGFPLTWEHIFGPGTAVWASEIEAFPIAVTKTYFKE